ncbi:MAG: T9SS type A sorting domain-containing protein, partial [Ignavibacteriota bacterium]
IISINQGTTWHQTENIGLPSLNFYLFARSGGILYSEFPSGDIYRTTIPAISKVETSTNPKTTLSIIPNPISSLAEISYSLENSGIVSLEIYDELGRIVASQISNQRQEIGKHNISVDMKNLSSGIYHCRLRTGGDDKISKFVVAH